MRWTPWYMTDRYAHRTAGNGAFIELARVTDLETTNDPDNSVFLQGDDATQLGDEIDRAESLADGASGWREMLDNLIDPYFT